jgi:hypothetical protein
VKHQAELAICLLGRAHDGPDPADVGELETGEVEVQHRVLAVVLEGRVEGSLQTPDIRCVELADQAEAMGPEGPAHDHLPVAKDDLLAARLPALHPLPGCHSHPLQDSRLALAD